MAIEITKLFQFIRNNGASSIDLSVQANRTKLNAMIGVAADGNSLTQFRPNAQSNSLVNLLTLNSYLALSNSTNYTLGTGAIQPTATPFVPLPTSTPAGPTPTPFIGVSDRASGSMMAYGNGKIIMGSYPENYNNYNNNDIFYFFYRPIAFSKNVNNLNASASKIYLPDADSRLWQFTPSYFTSAPSNTIDGTFFVNGKFFLFPGSSTTIGWDNRTGDRFYTSTDGVNWTTNYWPSNIKIAMGGSIISSGFSYGNGKYVLIPYQIEPYQVAGDVNPKFLTITSNNGINWSRNDIDSTAGNAAWSGPMFDSIRNRFLVPRGGQFVTSTDGINWSYLSDIPNIQNFGPVYSTKFNYYAAAGQSWIYFLSTPYSSGNANVYMSTDGGSTFQTIATLPFITNNNPRIFQSAFYVNPATLDRYFVISIGDYETWAGGPHILRPQSGLYVLKNTTWTKIENYITATYGGQGQQDNGVFDGMTVNPDTGTLYYNFKQPTDPLADGYGVQYFLRSYQFN